MSAFEQLPPDQRATLSLLLRRRKSYAEVAKLLELDQRAVHDRAHAGLALLAPALARAVPQQLREQVADYLLGQQDERQALLTRAQIAASAPAREWAKALAVELVHVTADQLPEIPEPSEREGDAPPARELDRPARGAATTAPSEAVVDDARVPTDEEPGRHSSRRGGFALLGLIAVVVVVAIVLVVSSGKGSGKNVAGTGPPRGTSAGETEASSETTSTTNTSGSESASGGTTKKSSSAHVEKDISLTAPHGGKATGGVVVGSEGEKHAFLLAARGLQPTNGFKYVAWLINSKGEADGLGIAPEVSSSGELNAGGALPANASSYDRIEVTRNTEAKPKRPGAVVLEGEFKVG
jgi:hypothetical protein